MPTLSRFARASKRVGIVTVLALAAAALPAAGGIAAADEAPVFQIGPTAFDFGDVRVGTSEQRVVTVTNRGSSAETLNLAGGAAGQFGGTQNCQGQTLQPDESCQFFYTFSPTEPGEATGSTNGTVNGQPFSLSFVGNGVGAVALSGTGIDFGAVAVGSSVQRSIDVVNIAAQPVTLNLTGGAAGQFGGTQNCQGQTLQPDESCQLFYTFSPTEPGEVTGSTNGTLSGQPFSLSFRGVGIRQFVLSATALDFGPVAVGSSRQESS